MRGPLLPTWDLGARGAETLEAIRVRTDLAPRVGLTLGSGLGGVIDGLEQAVVFPTSELPHWPRSTVPGHAGRLALGYWQGVPLAALSGRSHRYEGYSLDQVTFAVRVMHALGARTMIFTNAVGAIHPEYRPGDLMIALDHINWIGRRGLMTPGELTERRAGRRVAQIYTPALREALLQAAMRIGLRLHRGVLMGGLGPTYETAAEIRMANALGADVACMSTVHEATLASHLGCQVASLSCVTNRATGLSDRALSHEEVTEVADQVAARLAALLDEYLKAAAGPPGSRP
jgi:purine-nucleoside phosphorylase